MADPVVIWLERHFTLERGLIAGGLLLIMGVLVDGMLAYFWLAYSNPMENTVHLAFVATNVIALSVNIIFSSFLIGLLLQDLAEEAFE